jgi:hypothetical protein
LLRVRIESVGDRRRDIAASGIGDASESVGKVSHLPRPAPVVAGELVYEEKWWAGAGFLDMEGHVLVDR